MDKRTTNTFLALLLIIGYLAFLSFAGRDLALAMFWLVGAIFLNCIAILYSSYMSSPRQGLTTIKRIALVSWFVFVTSLFLFIYLMSPGLNSSELERFSFYSGAFSLIMAIEAFSFNLAALNEGKRQLTKKTKQRKSDVAIEFIDKPYFRPIVSSILTPISVALFMAAGWMDGGYTGMDDSILKSLLSIFALIALGGLVYSILAAFIVWRWRKLIYILFAFTCLFIVAWEIFAISFIG